MNNTLSKEDEPLNFNNAVSSFVLNDDEKIPEINEEKETGEKRDEMDLNKVGNNKEEKQEEERNEELLVFNLKFIKTALLTNVQVKKNNKIYLEQFYFLESLQLF